MRTLLARSHNGENRREESDRPSWWRSALILVPALSFLLVFGGFGVLRYGHPQVDLWTLYSAGAHFLDGQMPYGTFDVVPWVKAIGLESSYYAYPPHFSPLVMAAALISFPAAKLVSIVLNMVATITLAWIVALQMPKSDHATDDTLRRDIAMAVIIASPFAAHVIWLANTSLIVMACICGAWLFAARGQAVAAGVLLGLASWKPQLALLPALWFLLERRSVSLIAVGITAVLLASWHFAAFGVIVSIVAWLSSLAAYAASTHADFGWQHSFGIQDLVFTLSGLKLRLELLAFPALALLWSQRRWFTPLEQLALVCVITVMFLPILDYDLVAFAPLAGAVLARSARSWRNFVLPAISCVVLFIPLRLVLKLDVQQLVQYRVVAVLAVRAWLIADVVRVAQSSAVRSFSAHSRAARPLSSG